MLCVELDLMSREFFLLSVIHCYCLENDNKSLNPAETFICTVTVKVVQNNLGLRKHKEYQLLTFLLPSKSDAMLNSK